MLVIICWRFLGHIPAQGLSAVYGLVQFASFEFLTKRVDLLFNMKTQSEVVDFLCGAASGCIATTSAMPLDVIRTRLVAQGEPKASDFYINNEPWEFEIGQRFSNLTGTRTWTSWLPSKCTTIVLPRPPTGAR
jgi:hypothetical protein